MFKDASDLLYHCSCLLKVHDGVFLISDFVNRKFGVFLCLKLVPKICLVLTQASIHICNLHSIH